jgi:RNA polymerase sigma-32 factor
MSTGLLLKDQNLDRYIAEVKSYALLGRDEEAALARRFRDEGDVAAAHELVVSNLRFVVKVAHQYKGYGFKLLDLIQEGNIGLMMAVKKFDPERGYRLISYAVWWIRAQIHSYLMKSWSMVKLGTTLSRRKLFFKLRSTRSKLEQEARGGKISAADLAESLGVSERDVNEMDMRMASRDFSLDAHVGEDTSTSHLDMLESQSANQEELIGEAQERALLHETTHQALENLDEREREIIQRRYLAEEPVTLQQIGDDFGVSRERVRQLESRALKKLRGAVEPVVSATRAF